MLTRVPCEPGLCERLGSSTLARGGSPAFGLSFSCIHGHPLPLRRERSGEDLAGDLARRLQVPEPMRVLRLDRISYAFASEPVEYRIYRSRAESARLIFDLN